jgi:arginine-tRNA-protein transferase
MVERKSQSSTPELVKPGKRSGWEEHEADFFISHPHKCEYLTGVEAMTIFTSSVKGMDTDSYEGLLENGFRRSGKVIYRPHCPTCNSCISVRVPVAAFRMSRNMKKIWNRNNDLVVNSLSPTYSHEHFELYQSYVRNRHRGGSMDCYDPDAYMSFLASSSVDTRFYEFRREEKLLMVAVVDHLKQGLSSVYTFFDTCQNTRSLGTFGILWEIDQALRLRKQWLYLGYWIPNCRKMQYKSRFRPLEAFQKERWELL